MVSVGTVASLGIIGAIVIGGYALYRNSGKIGGALSRGVETNLTSPLGNYFDNLWKGTPTNSNSSSTITQDRGPTSEQLQKERLELNDRYQKQYQQQYGQTIKGYQDTLDVYKKLLDAKPTGTVAPPLPKTFPGEEHRKANPTAPKNEPLFAPSPSGYYYQNFTPGGRADRQIKLKQGSADALRKRGYDLHFLTPSQKLSQSAFTTFGKSKGYL